MFRNMPMILLSLIVGLFVLDDFIPYAIKSQALAISLSVKSLIIFSLPFIIFMLLFKTVSQLSKDATKMILLILTAVCCSNFLSTMISYQIGSNVFHLDLSLALPEAASILSPAWSFSLPKLVSNDIAMFSGLILGVLFSFVHAPTAARLSTLFDRVVTLSFRILTYIVPLFIAGFVIKLNHEKLIQIIAKDYALIFFLVALSLMVYIACIYLVANRFIPSRFLQSLKNMLPAAVAGFSSMSSAAAMPLSLIGSEKNLKNPALARLSIPTTVNIHLIGDCFAIPIFAFAVMKNYGCVEPLFSSYLIFALYFVLAKFSVAAIPGGGILVMLPILESQLGFTSEMSSMITALYVLFDPVITCANVLGNGGFAQLLDRVTHETAPVADYPSK